MLPSQEEFQRAMAIIQEDHRGLEEVAASVVEHFWAEGLVSVQASFCHQRQRFDFIVFLETDALVLTVEQTGLAGRVRAFTEAELERVGRGTRRHGRLKIHLTYDSEENVQRYHGGNFFHP